MSDVLLYTYPQRDGKYRLKSTLAVASMKVRARGWGPWGGAGALRGGDGGRGPGDEETQPHLWNSQPADEEDPGL